MYNSYVNRNIEQVCNSLDGRRGNSVDKNRVKDMSTSIVVRSRTFYAKNKCAISPIQGGKKKCSNVSNQISHKSQKLTDSNRFAVLGVLGEQEIIKLLDKN